MNRKMPTDAAIPDTLNKWNSMERTFVSIDMILCAVLEHMRHQSPI